MTTTPSDATVFLPFIEDGRHTFSVSEAARFVSLGKTTLYRLIGSGDLPSAKIGSRRLIRRADLEALIASNQLPYSKSVTDRYHS